MNIVTWILAGAIISILASIYRSHPERGGRYGSIILGIFGAILGGFLAYLILQISFTGFDSLSLLIAISGTISILALRELLTVNVEKYTHINYQGGGK